MLALKLELNRRNFVVDHSNYKVLADMSREGEAYRLPPDLALWVREHHKQSNRWVAQTFFQCNELFEHYESGQEQGLELTEEEFKEELANLREKAVGSITRA